MITLHLVAADGAAHDLTIPDPLLIVKAARASGEGRAPTPTVRGQVTVPGLGPARATAKMPTPTITSR